MMTSFCAKDLDGLSSRQLKEQLALLARSQQSYIDDVDHIVYDNLGHPGLVTKFNLLSCRGVMQRAFNTGVKLSVLDDIERIHASRDRLLNDLNNSEQDVVLKEYTDALETLEQDVAAKIKEQRIADAMNLLGNASKLIFPKTRQHSDVVSSLSARLSATSILIWEGSLECTSTSCSFNYSSGLLEAMVQLHMENILATKLAQMMNKLWQLIIAPVLQGSCIVYTATKVALSEQGEQGLPAVRYCLSFLLLIYECLSAGEHEHESMVKSGIRAVKLVFLTQLREHVLSRLGIPLKALVLQKSASQVNFPRFWELVVQELQVINNLLQPLREVDPHITPELLSDMEQLWLDAYCTFILTETRKRLCNWSGETEPITRVIPARGHPQFGNVSPKLVTEYTATDEQDSKTDELEDGWGSADWEIEDEEVDRPLPGLESNPPINLETLHDFEDTRDLQGFSGSHVITTIPKDLLHIIRTYGKGPEGSGQRTTEDKPSWSNIDLYNTLSAIVLECYKSLVPWLIRRTGYSPMTIYNDCIFLANQVQSTTDMKIFGETYYLAELSEKQKAVHEIMQKTRSFISCTAADQVQTCREAIQEVIDLLHRLHERYDGQLPQTTMFTALGTLTNTALEYMIDSIMSMSDISEAESMQLALLGDQLSTLEHLFKIHDEDESPLIAMWCSSWFRFRYLLDILEAKLDYILELWNGGSLSDYTAVEVTDLIRALFSDSSKRREVISRIEHQT